MKWEQLIEEAATARRQLHRIPELCWQEHKTCRFIEARLEQLGVSWRRCAGTGLVVRLAPDAPGEHVGLRCDMDGLPMTERNGFDYVSTVTGRMHGCGHDGHMATMVAVVSWLKLHESILPGPVTCIFQPAEEGGHGARGMIDDGALRGVDRIFGWHNWPAIDYGKAICPAGPLMAANASFEIELTGRGGHASQPELCRDPVLAAAAVTLGLQQVISRRLAPQKAGVVSVTSIDGRSGETIIGDKAKLGGSVRMSKTADIKGVGKEIASIADAIAAGYGVSADVQYEERYPAVINEEKSATTLSREMGQILGDDWSCRKTAAPIMASEDFSYYLEKIPGAFALVGAGDGAVHSIACHNTAYDFNDKLIEPMARLLVRIAGAPDPKIP